MKKILSTLTVIAFLATGGIAFADDTSTPTAPNNPAPVITDPPEEQATVVTGPAGGPTVLLAANTAPTRRTFAYQEELAARIANGETGQLVLSAGCATNTFTDNTTTDESSSNPKFWTAYAADGREILDSDYADAALDDMPEAIQRKVTEIAKYEAKKKADAATTTETS